MKFCWDLISVIGLCDGMGHNKLGVKANDQEVVSFTDD